jgi:20S proteasome alpha/beta subunit
MLFEDVVGTAIAALKAGVEDELTKDNVRLAYVKGETKKYHMASKEEIDGFLAKSV